MRYRYLSRLYRKHLDTPTMIKTFYIKYEKELSIADKLLLRTLQQKYFYHAMDDILAVSKAKPSKQNNLLALLTSPVLYLHNNFAIDFFNIWIEEISITRMPKHNKFLANDNSTFESFSYITLKLRYIYKSPKKKPEPLW